MFPLGGKVALKKYLYFNRPKQLCIDAKDHSSFTGSNYTRRESVPVNQPIFRIV